MSAAAEKKSSKSAGAAKPKDVFVDAETEAAAQPPTSPSRPLHTHTGTLKHKVSAPSLATISSSLSDSFRWGTHSRTSSASSNTTASSLGSGRSSFHRRGSSSVSSAGSFAISSPVIVVSPQSFEYVMNQGMETLAEDIKRISAVPPRPAPAPPVQASSPTHRRTPSLSKKSHQDDLAQCSAASGKDETLDSSANSKANSCSASNYSSTSPIQQQQHIQQIHQQQLSSPQQRNVLPLADTGSFYQHRAGTGSPTTRLPPNVSPPQLLYNGYSPTSVKFSTTPNPLGIMLPPDESQQTSIPVAYGPMPLNSPQGLLTPLTTAALAAPTVAATAGIPLLRSFSSFHATRYEDFSQLTYLDLSALESTASFISATGRLPRWIQRCTALQYLIGCRLNLTVIEEWVSQSLIQLRVIRLNDNQIGTWPDHLAQLLPYDQLTVVDLEGNPCFTNYCDRCPQFALDYAKSIGLSSREASRKFLSSAQMASYASPASKSAKKQMTAAAAARRGSLRPPSGEPVHETPSTAQAQIQAPTASAPVAPYASTPMLASPTEGFLAVPSGDPARRRSGAGFFGRRHHHKKSYSAQLQNTLAKLSYNVSTTSIESSDTVVGGSTGDASSAAAGRGAGSGNGSCDSTLAGTEQHDDEKEKETAAVSDGFTEVANNGSNSTLSSPTETAGASNASTLYIDDDSDDEALTSLEPVIHTKYIGREALSPTIAIQEEQEPLPGGSTGSTGQSSSPSLSPSSGFTDGSGKAPWGTKRRVSHFVADTSESISTLLNNQLGPDTWAQKRIEPSEIEKSKVVLNLLRDIWEMSTSSILYPVPDLSAEAVAAAAARRESFSHDTRSDPVLSKGSVAASVATATTVHSAERMSGHVRKNSVDAIQGYLESDSVEPDAQHTPSKKEVAKLLSTLIDEEKMFIKRMNELMTIYVKSKKCPPKAAKIFTDLEPIYNLHSAVVRPGLQKCFDLFVSNKDPRLDRLSSLILANINEFRVYIRYEVAMDESLRLANFWKRLIGGDSSQSMVSYGANVPHLANYSHPDAIIAEWIKGCHRHKSHTLHSVTDYLQLPSLHLDRYRGFLKAVAPFSPNLWEAWDQFDSICKEIEEERPLATESRRHEEFEQVYGFAAQLPPRAPPAPQRRYLGDAIVLLKSEIFLELPTRLAKADCIDYMMPTAPHCVLVTHSKKNGSSNGHASESSEPNSSTDSTTSSKTSSSTVCTSPLASESTMGSTYNTSRANPVPKIVQKHVIKSKYNLALRRIIVFDDVVVFTDEDKKRVDRVVPRAKMTATLPWKYPVREGTEALPTGDQVSYKSKSSVNSVYNQNRFSISSTTFGSVNTQYTTASSSPHGRTHANSGALRIMFHEDPKVWYCVLRSFNCERRLASKEARSRLVELFTIN